jgi:nucleotide-binding universal stress UspA family protein
MKVVLAIDGSESSLRATQFIVGLVKGRDGTEVHIVNVQSPVRYLDLLSKEKQQLAERLTRERGEQETARAREALAEARVPFHLQVVVGEDAATAIVQVSKKLDCDLIVMGTRGMATITGLVLGSVASKVIHLADAAVTMVK